MKLRNKKTDEIGSLVLHGCEDERLWVWIDNKSIPEYRYNSLAELNAEWEDYEESKDFWFVDAAGEVQDTIYLTHNDKSSLRNFGNYFETKEEAENVVEKLKAWKRLKDKGFRFEGWDNTDRSTIHNFSLFVAIEDLENINKDLDLLFGGGE